MSTDHITLDQEQVQPPTRAYVPPGAGAVVKILSVYNNIPVTVTMRLLLRNGNVTPIQHTFLPPGAGAIYTFYFPLAEGYILSAIVSSTTTNITRGNTYVQVSLAQSPNASAVPLQLLIAGYLSDLCALGYPDGLFEAVANPTPLIRAYTWPDPDPGQIFVIEIPAAARALFQSLSWTFNTDATVGNRLIRVTLEANGATIWQSNQTITVPASTTITIYCALNALESTPITDGGNVRLPYIWITSSPYITLNIAGIQSGDALSGITYSLLALPDY